MVIYRLRFLARSYVELINGFAMQLSNWRTIVVSFIVTWFVAVFFPWTKRARSDTGEYSLLWKNNTEYRRNSVWENPFFIQGPCFYSMYKLLLTFNYGKGSISGFEKMKDARDISKMIPLQFRPSVCAFPLAVTWIHLCSGKNFNNMIFPFFWITHLGKAIRRC